MSVYLSSFESCLSVQCTYMARILCVHIQLPLNIYIFWYTPAFSINYMYTTCISNVLFISIAQISHMYIYVVFYIFIEFHTYLYSFIHIYTAYSCKNMHILCVIVERRFLLKILSHSYDEYMYVHMYINSKLLYLRTFTLRRAS